MDFYKKMVDNDKLRTRVKSNLFDLIYLEYKKKNKQSKYNTVNIDNELMNGGN